MPAKKLRAFTVEELGESSESRNTIFLSAEFVKNELRLVFPGKEVREGKGTGFLCPICQKGEICAYEVTKNSEGEVFYELRCSQYDKGCRGAFFGDHRPNYARR